MATETHTDSRVYTYRNGKKIYLKKEADQFVVRAKPEDLPTMGITGDVEKVSPSSTRVTVNKEMLDPAMEKAREKVTTHHAYTQEDSGTEFLITDRIIVTFKKPPTNDVLNTFIAKYGLMLRRKYSDKEFLFQLT